jgi:hypothetical protein
MIIDAKLNFGGMALVNGQYVPAAQGPITASAASTDVIDLGTNAQSGYIRRSGSVTDLYLVLINTGSTMAGTTPTLSVTLETDSAVGFGTKVSTTITTGTAPAWTAGQIIIIPVDNSQLKQYIRLYYTAGGTVSTGPTIKAFLTDSPADWYAYADAI